MQKLLWVDTETTGLDPENGFLLEVGMSVTNEHLEVMDTFVTPVALPEGWTFSRGSMINMHEKVRKMHEKSGLLRLVEKHGVPLEKAEASCVRWMENVEATNLTIAGSNPGFDRKWLEAHMPEVAELFHYRSFDMNTLYYFFDIVDEVKDGRDNDRAHRALDDINMDISVAQQIVSMLDARCRIKRGINRPGFGLPWK